MVKIDSIGNAFCLSCADEVEGVLVEREENCTNCNKVKKEQKKLDYEYAKEQLMTHYINEGDTIYTVLRSVASSGMSRTMSLKVAKDGKILDLTYYASVVLDYPLVEVNGSRAIRVGGCGMDMGFHVVYSLARVLFRDKYEVQPEAVDAGYSLSQAWL